MKIIFGIILKDSNGREFQNIYDPDQDTRYLGQIEKANNSESWYLNHELQQVFQLPGTTDHHKNLTIKEIREKLEEVALSMTSYQAQVRLTGYEEYLDERPTRGLNLFTTTQLWAEIMARIVADPAHHNLSMPDGTDQIESIIAETAPLPNQTERKNPKVACQHLENIEDIAEHLAFLSITHARSNKTEDRLTARKQLEKLIEIRDKTRRTATTVEDFTDAAVKYRHNTPVTLTKEG